jgi:hypothetical protein
MGQFDHLQNQTPFHGSAMQDVTRQGVLDQATLVAYDGDADIELAREGKGRRKASSSGQRDHDTAVLNGCDGMPHALGNHDVVAHQRAVQIARK